MIDVASLATALGFEPAPVVWAVYPAATTSDAFGETALGTPTEHAEEIVVHPTGRRTLSRLVHADQRRETISLYTARTDISAEAAAPTRVSYSGRTYEVAAVGDYTRMGGIVLVHAQLVDEVAA